MVERENEPKKYNPNSYEVLSPLQFIKDFSEEAKNAKERVWTQSMVFQTGTGTSVIENSLIMAAKRKVDARRTRDYFTNIEMRKVNSDKKEEILFQDRDSRKKMREAGVLLTTTNKTFFADVFPFFWRNHTKVHIVDNVAWIGGVNLRDDHYDRADFVVKIKNPEVVSALAMLFVQVNKNRPLKDYKKKINDEFTLWVDRGSIGKSIIYERAEQMVDQAQKSIRFISQLPPSGKLLHEMIKSADRGVRVCLVLPSYQYVNRVSFPFNKLAQFENWRLARAVSGHEKNMNIVRFEGNNGLVHGKMIVTDEKNALWGSHNFARSGVMAGTQEADLETTNPLLIKKLTNWFDSIPNGTYDLGFQQGPFNPLTAQK